MSGPSIDVTGMTAPPEKWRRIFVDFGQPQPAHSAVTTSYRMWPRTANQIPLVTREAARFIAADGGLEWEQCWNDEPANG